MTKKYAEGERVIIKKYANRRLYDTSTSSYVTLDHLSELVKRGVDFVVQDAKSGDDLTRGVLTQIIFEQENKGENVLPLGFLRQIIQFYGDSMQSLLPAYLDMSMSGFIENQERWRQAMTKTMGGNPMAMFEEQARRNMALFEKSMSVFSPPTRTHPMPEKARSNGRAAAKADVPAPKPEVDPAPSLGTDQISALQQQLSDMQRQLEKLSRNGAG